jgi:hypothetical protein
MTKTGEVLKKYIPQKGIEERGSILIPYLIINYAGS